MMNIVINFSNKTLFRLLSSIIFLFSIYYLISPYYTLHKFRQASNYDDYGYFDDNIYYEGIKESILEGITNDLTRTGKANETPSGIPSYISEKLTGVAANLMLESNFNRRFLKKYSSYLLNSGNYFSYNTEYKDIDLFYTIIDLTDYIKHIKALNANYEQYEKDFFKNKKITVKFIFKRDHLFNWRLVGIAPENILPYIAYMEANDTPKAPQQQTYESNEDNHYTFLEVLWLRAKSYLGDNGAQFNLAKMYYKGIGVPSDKQTAFEWYRKAAEQGNKQAQNMLGIMYKRGEYVQADKGKALEWFLKAAEQGNSKAQFNVGDMYYFQGDKGKAFEWFLKAAEQSNSSAQFEVGRMYFFGEYIQEDKGKAFEWFLKAAEQGNSDAQNFLGMMYIRGTYVQVDNRKAFEWFLKAAEQGNSNAQYSVGVIYYDGFGIQADKKKGFEWLQKAAKNGDNLAKAKLSNIKNEKN